MSAQIPRPFGTRIFASALLTVGALAAPETAFAADCLTAPNPSTPPNNHWYYRTDRAHQRKCWFLQADNAGSEHKSAAATDQAISGNRSQSASKEYSLASFKEFMTQQTGVTPSDRDVEQLYGAFLEWNRRAKN